MPGWSIRILLVEDNLAEARLLQEFLNELRLSQFRLFHVKRLQEALERLQQDRFDVVLLDLTLPDSQGLTSLETLIDRAPNLPIVVLTNTNDSDLAIEAVRLGAQDYLVKRLINAEVLVRSIRYAIERKQASEALREANEALERRVQERTAELAQANELLRQEIRERERVLCEYQRAQAELQRSNAELRQFAYVASHDLQEPLRTVTSFVQLLVRRYEGQVDTQAKEYIDYIVDGTKRMHDLIQALLGYSRVGRSTKEFEPIACDEVLQAVLQRLKRAIAESEAVITHDPLPTVVADPVQLGQLFQNLIDNAIKYRRTVPPQIHVSAVLRPRLSGSLSEEISTGQIGVGPACDSLSPSALSHTAQEWIFSVRDNGIGIAAEYFDRVFLIFQRLHTRSEYPGTGIGLALCRKIIERHGGHIWIESEPGQGSTFFFSIPDVSEELLPKNHLSLSV